METGFVSDPVFLEHRSSHFHPECPERLLSIIKKLENSALSDRLKTLSIGEQAASWLKTVHTSLHIHRIMETARSPSAFIDPDTYVNPRSWLAASRAVQAVLAAVDAVVERRVQNAFCAVRPPGHHAESNRAMGFCLLNNIAVGARYAQRHHGLSKVFIVDWDVHHGNGTQEIFYDDSSVFYFSLHQYPLYPGTGSADETGTGSGRGYTLNVPLPSGSGDGDYIRVFENELSSAVDQFKPDLIMISAGFDAHAKDPLAGMNLSAAGFGRLTRIVKRLAQYHADNRLIAVLEGGYHFEALADSVEAHLNSLLED